MITMVFLTSLTASTRNWVGVITLCSTKSPVFRMLPAASLICQIPSKPLRVIFWADTDSTCINREAHNKSTVATNKDFVFMVFHIRWVSQTFITEQQAIKKVYRNGINSRFRVLFFVYFLFILQPNKKPTQMMDNTYSSFPLITNYRRCVSKINPSFFYFSYLLLLLFMSEIRKNI